MSLHFNYLSLLDRQLMQLALPQSIHQAIVNSGQQQSFCTLVWTQCAHNLSAHTYLHAEVKLKAAIFSVGKFYTQICKLL